LGIVHAGAIAFTCGARTQSGIVVRQLCAPRGIFGVQTRGCGAGGCGGKLPKLVGQIGASID